MKLFHIFFNVYKLAQILNKYLVPRNLPKYCEPSILISRLLLYPFLPSLSTSEWNKCERDISIMYEVDFVPFYLNYYSWIIERENVFTQHVCDFCCCCWRRKWEKDCLNGLYSSQWQCVNVVVVSKWSTIDENNVQCTLRVDYYVEVV